MARFEETVVDRKFESISRFEYSRLCVTHCAPWCCTYTYNWACVSKRLTILKSVDLPSHELYTQYIVLYPTQYLSSTKIICVYFYRILRNRVISILPHLRTFRNEILVVSRLNTKELSQLFPSARSSPIISRIEATVRAPIFRGRPWTRVTKDKLLDNFASVVNPLKQTCGSISHGRSSSQFLALGGAQYPKRVYPRSFASPFSSSYFTSLSPPDCHSPRGENSGEIKSLGFLLLFLPLPLILRFHRIPE